MSHSNWGWELRTGSHSEAAGCKPCPQTRALGGWTRFPKCSPPSAPSAAVARCLLAHNGASLLSAKQNGFRWALCELCLFYGKPLLLRALAHWCKRHFRFDGICWCHRAKSTAPKWGWEQRWESVLMVARRLPVLKQKAIRTTQGINLDLKLNHSLRKTC